MFSFHTFYFRFAILLSLLTINLEAGETSIFRAWFDSLMSMVNSSAAKKTTSAVYYTVSKGGRFGDKFLLVSHAAWFAHALKLPLVYQPFPYSDQLNLDEDPSLLREVPNLPNRLRVYKVDDYLQFYATLNREGKFNDTLIEVPFYPESPYLFEEKSNRAQFTQINWKDPAFLARLRKWFSPKKPFPKLELPKDKVTVALHYRTGENHDKPGWQDQFILKGPPDSFYIDSLRTLLAIEKRPLYVFIFTDGLNPPTVAAKFQALFPSVEFAVRTDKPAEEAVLEDFFAMDGFDCLIRPESHFSMAAAYLFPFRIILSPANFRRIDPTTILVDQILLEFNSEGIPPFETTLRL